MMEPN